MSTLLDAIEEAFPGETEFKLMTKDEWNKLAQFLSMFPRLPAELKALHVLTIELRDV